MADPKKDGAPLSATPDAPAASVADEPKAPVIIPAQPKAPTPRANPNLYEVVHGTLVFSADAAAKKGDLVELTEAEGKRLIADGIVKIAT